MVLRTGTPVSLVGPPGAVGPGVLTTSGKPDDSVGVSGQYAVDPAQGFVYGPKGATSWPSTPPLNMQGPSGPQGPVGAQGPAGAAGSNATLPQDFTPNSVAIAPVSGNSNASVLTQKDGSGNTLFQSDASGNATHAGTLSVGGTSTLKALIATLATISGNASVGGTLGVTAATTLSSTLSVAGASSLAGVSATTLATSGNATVGGTLGVTGQSTLGATTASSAQVNGILGVSGQSVLAAVNATNVAASGTLNVAGASTQAAISATSLGVSGGTTLASATVSGTATVKNLTLQSGGGGVVTFADGTTQATASTSSGGSGSGIASRSVVFMGQLNNTGLSANGLYGIFIPNPPVSGATVAATTYTPFDYHFPFMFQATIVGIAVTQAASNTSNTIYFYKNTGTSLGSISLGSSSGASTSSPSYFKQAIAANTYNFAVGDDLRIVQQVSGTATNIQVAVVFQWLT